MTLTKLNIRPAVRDINLSQDMTWSATGDLRGEQITCTAGKLWVTQENDWTDYVLNRGEMFWVTQSGAVVVQALQDGQFSFSRFSQPQKPGHN